MCRVADGEQDRINKGSRNRLRMGGTGVSPVHVDLALRVKPFDSPLTGASSSVAFSTAILSSEAGGIKLRAVLLVLLLECASCQGTPKNTGETPVPANRFRNPEKTVPDVWYALFMLFHFQKSPHRPAG